MKPFFVLLLTLIAVSSFGAAQASTLKERRQCVQQLCGPMSHLLNLEGGGSFETARPPEVVALLQEIKPIMNKIIALNTAFYREGVLMLGSADAILADESLTQNERVILGLAAYGLLPWSEVKSALTMTAQGKKWDRQKLAKFWPELSAEEIEWAAGVDEQIEKARYFQVANFVRGRPVGNMLEYLDIKPEGYVPFIDNVLEVAEQIRQWFGPIFVPDRFVEAIQRARDNTKLDASEQAAFVEGVATVLRWTELSAGTMRPIFAAYPISSGRFMERIRSKWKKLAVRIEAANGAEGLKKQIVGRCAGKIAARYNSSPSRDELAKFNGTAETVRKAALQALPDYFWGNTLTIAQSAVLRARFFNPPSRPDVSASMLNTFRTELRDYKLVATMNEKSKLIRFILSVALQAETDPLTDVLFSSLSRACDEIAPPKLLDATILNSGAVTIGWQSVKWPGYGVGIIAHEIGHLIQAHGEVNAEITTVRSCQIQQHKTIYAVTSPDGQTEDEDWADTFSLSVQKRIHKIWPHTLNFACTVMDLDTNTNDFEKDSPDLSTDSENSHSTGIFRAISQQIGRGKLPPVCSSLSELKNKTLRTCSK